MKGIIFFALFCTMMFYSCSDNTVSPKKTPTSVVNYQKILSFESGNNKIEVYSATDYRLVSGYNDVGFKAYQNGTEMNTGYVKFSPHMWHNPPVSSTHSTPVSPQFNYDSQKELFTGYISFFMVTDSLSHWYGFFNYNEVFHIDSVQIQVYTNPSSQVRAFVDYQMSTGYFITLVSPMSPVQGLNDFKCLLHSSVDNINYTEIDSAQMSIFPWMHLMGHGSSNNQNPVYTGNGIYAGVVNLNMSGEWYVYDTVRYQGRVITPINDPPKFICDSP